VFSFSFEVFYAGVPLRACKNGCIYQLSK